MRTTNPQRMSMARGRLSRIRRRPRPPSRIRPPGRPTITERFVPDNVDVLLGEAEVHARIDALAERLAPTVSQGVWTGVVIMLGATPFASDLLRAFSRIGQQ